MKIVKKEEDLKLEIDKLLRAHGGCLGSERRRRT